MKALVYYNTLDVRLEKEWPDPPPCGPDEVTIQVSWCGICGTDLEEYFLEGGIIPVKEPHQGSGKKAPIILGHEFSGRIVEKGSSVLGLGIGQKVAVECLKACGQCYWCQTKNFTLCQKHVVYGLYDDGGMAEFVKVKAELCFAIPDDMPEDIAALTEPFAVTVRGARKSRLKLGETAAIIGAGAIGLCNLEAAKLAGARNIIVIAHGGRRAEAAREMGANHVLNSNDAGWKEEYYALTDGLGADVVFDTGGSTASFSLALELTRCEGRCIMVSVINDDLPVHGIDMLMKQKEIIGTNSHTHVDEFKWAFEAIRDKRVNLNPVITDRIHLDDALEKGIKRLKADKNQIKIMVTPIKELLK